MDSKKTNTLRSKTQLQKLHSSIHEAVSLESQKVEIPTKIPKTTHLLIIKNSIMSLLMPNRTRNHITTALAHHLYNTRSVMSLKMIQHLPLSRHHLHPRS